MSSPLPSPNPSVKQKSVTPKAQTSIQNHNQLQHLILSHQNTSQPYKGYYRIEQWRNLNNILFHPTHYQQKTVITNCWRLMKLINFGDDVIPTGLIFDCVMTLMNVDQSVDQTQKLLKKIFVKFIEINGKYLTPQQRQQLMFFKVVRNVVQGYRKIIAQKLDLQNQQSEKNIDQKPQDRNQQLYLLHGVMTYKKDLQKLKKIETQFKQCTFEPKLNEHSAQIGQSRYRQTSQKKITQRQSQKQSPYGVIDQNQEFSQSPLSPDSLFKARPIPQYPSLSPSRQFFDHIERIRKSRQIRSINSIVRPSAGSSTVKQFSINQRQQQRKQNLLQNVKILFMIKVEVGKRVYRVKVRQNMTINQIVQAIWKMVGFQDKGIIDVVKAYFINYERREKNKLANKQFSQSSGHHSSDGY